jgi:type I restriction enzyme, S subunit
VNPYVNWSDIERYEFDLPPLAEQKRVADFLWTVEASVRSQDDLRLSMTLARQSWLDGLVSALLRTQSVE